MKKINSLIAFLLIAVVSMAQSHHDHSFTEDDIMVTENFKKEFPHLADKVDSMELALENFTKEYEKQIDHHVATRGSAKYIIPVVFHILHENGPENVTDTEIHDAMRILNEDFQKLNADTANAHNNFKPIIGNAQIEFRLARKDPNGDPTTGIDRIETSLTNSGGENSKLNPWPRGTYLNVWIVKAITSGAAGYTFLPSTAHWRPTKDGIILLYNYFASVRTGNDRRSRALTHEIGHWLNLPHPWGRSNNPGLSTNCSDDDGVGDTPNTIGWRSCNVNGVSCGSLDNVQNYMEYSYCSNMFTAGQVARMQAALNNGAAQRDDLVSEANNRAAGVLGLEYVGISVDKQHLCVGETVSFTDRSLNDVVSWSWEFEGGSPSTSSDKNPQVYYSKPGNHAVKLTVTDSYGKKMSKEFNNYMVVNRSVGTFLPYENGFETLTESDNFNWVSINEDHDEVEWKLSNVAAHRGSKSLMLENFNNIHSQVEAIVSEPFDLSNIVNPEFSFYLAHASKPGVYGGLSQFNVYYSNDCGVSWKKMYSNISQALTSIVSNAYYVPTRSEWNLITVQGFADEDKVQNGLFKFEVINSVDNNFYIDNIALSGNYSDVPVLEFPLNGMDSVSKDIVLDWKMVLDCDQYVYEVATDTGFTNVVASGVNNYIDANPNLDDTELKLTNLDAGKTYYWRVSAITGSITSNWSDVWSFTVSATGVGHKYLDDFKEETPSTNVAEVGVINASLNLFPNPSQGATTIAITGNEESTLIRIYTLQGKLVWENQVDVNGEVILESNTLAPGVYVVRATEKNFQEPKKLIIQ